MSVDNRYMSYRAVMEMQTHTCTQACHILWHIKLNHVSFLLCAGQNPTTVKANGWFASGLDSRSFWKAGEQSWV